MYEADKQDKFIELRAEGWSLGHIATELHMSKHTAVNWNREHAAQIQALRAARLGVVEDKILTSREDELSRLLRVQKDLEDELAHRDLARIPIDAHSDQIGHLFQSISDSDSD